MEFIELAAQRYSVRKFSSKIVEKEKLDLILKAGQLSPTACNNQPQRVLVIESEGALAKLKECTTYHFNAPLAFLICYDKTVSWNRPFDNDDSGDVDASIVTTHMMLQAAELGLGTTWVGKFDPVLVRNTFSIPDNYIPVAILPTGYPAEDATPSANHSKRCPVEQTVFYNQFLGR
jgi:nitroreductase